MMKIIVFAHRFEVGGTQTDAIEPAAVLRDLHGFEVTLFATPGPMVRLAEEKEIRFVPAPDAYVHPSRACMRALTELVLREKPDVVHVWDWWQLLDAFYSVHLRMGVPLVVSDTMMDLTRILPKHLPTTFGVPKLVDEALRNKRTRVELLLPPVDVSKNSMAAIDAGPFRQRFACRPDEIKLVTVSRLASFMKSGSLQRSIDVVQALGGDLPISLLIVGEGDARAGLERRAADVNKALGRKVIRLKGALLDPRAAYAAADIVIGMGGSSLRGMAFGKPVIIVGEQGFAKVFDRSTAAHFYRNGKYGRGRGMEDQHRLEQSGRALATQPQNLPLLGRLSREFVVEHFSLETVSARLAPLFRSTFAAPLPRTQSLFGGLRNSSVVLSEARFFAVRRRESARRDFGCREWQRGYRGKRRAPIKARGSIVVATCRPQYDIVKARTGSGLGFSTPRVPHSWPHETLLRRTQWTRAELGAPHQR